VKTRKDIRKEKRQLKKTNRFNYHNTKKKDKNGKVKGSKKKKDENEDMSGDEDFDEELDEEIPSDFDDQEESESPVPAKVAKKSLDKFEQFREREMKEETEYYNEIKKNRIEQLKQQNEDEDKIIGKYEKLLKLNKRKKKSGSVSMSKFTDGLDYLLELCTDESIQKMYSAAKEVDANASDDAFDEDLNLAMGKKSKDTKKSKKAKTQKPDEGEPEISPSEQIKTMKRSEKLKEVEKKYFGDDEDFFKNFDADSCEGSDSELESGDEMGEHGEYSDDEAPEEIQTNSKNKKKVKFEEPKKSKKMSDSDDSEFDIESESDGDAESEVEEDQASDDEEVDDIEENQDSAEEEDDQESADDEEESLGEDDDGGDSDESNEEDSDKKTKKKPAEWEDIYGRKRDADGNLIKEDTNKYVPPHLRKSLKSIEAENDPKRREKLQNLKRQIKGQVNRLAESNLHRISIDIENLYGKNARHDVNTTLTEVITDSIVSNVLAVERLVLEQTLLIATLHANIGSEIGAFFLQVIVEKFNELFVRVDDLNIANKELDNIIFIICHLYTYRLFKHNLIFELLNKLCEKMTEKRVECMLLVLRSIGFVLRKDDPLLLKEFIIKVQKLANTAGEESSKNTRIMFMLDILMAVKNNNVSKIPQYDPSLVEHFRKLLKQFVRAGKYVTTLAVTMDDLLNADERGKWWLVGSAWTGNEKPQSDEKLTTEQDSVGDAQRQKIMELARKQRMNTDDKKNIFYILMTAEDYLDAFEKIVSAVKDERTIVAVLIHCCLSEKDFNPYYGVLAQKFCDHNRKYLLAIQFNIWDKIKDINGLSMKQVSNLARLLSSLIENGNLPLSVLKVIEFNQIEKTTLRFLRQVMLSLLMIEEEKFHLIFEKIVNNAKLNPFKDQLRLFNKVFLMKDERKVNISEDELAMLKERIQLADKFLMVKHY
jgi:nucleolar MIF4G domain-containing protein 1